MEEVSRKETDTQSSFRVTNSLRPHIEVNVRQCWDDMAFLFKS